MSSQLNPVDLLCDYIEIDSSHPDAKTHKTAEFLKNILQARGVDVSVFAARPYKNNLVAKLPGTTESPIVLLHHMDVVGGSPAQFESRVENGQIWGRGAVDDKGLGVIHLLTFLRLLRDVKVGSRELSRPVWLLAVANEEVGGQLGGKYVAEGLFGDADFDIPPVVLDEGGYWISDMFSRPVANVSITEKRRGLVKLSFKGASTHGSIPPRERRYSAVLKAMDALNAFKALSRPLIMNEATKEVVNTIRRLEMFGLPVPKKMVAKLASRKSEKFYALTHNTVGITVVNYGSDDMNVIPAEMEVVLDIRLIPESSWQSMLQELKSVLARSQLQPGRDFSLEILEEPDPPAISDSTHKVVSAIHQVIERHSPETEVTISMLPGISDSRFFRLQGCEAYGFVPIKLTEDQLGNIHGSRERIPIEGLKNGIDIMYDVVSRLV